MNSSTKSRWAVFLTERFPLIPNLLISIGITLSAGYLTRGIQSGLTSSSWIAMIGGMLFLAQIRFMDEFKDFEKDKVAHPERPLPRGLFTLVEFSRFILIFNMAMLSLSVLAGFLIGTRSGVLFAMGTGYLFLMFKEFYVGEQLSNRPMLYAFSHQVIILPMGLFVLSCFEPDSLFNANSLWFCLLLLSSFFAFEVGRKLDPKAHPVLNTYLSRYGREKTAFFIAMLLAIAVESGIRVGMGNLLGPVFIGIMVLLSLLWWAPGRFKLIEGAVTLFLLLAIWGLPIRHWMGL
jgi:4-hydroxybenzoate polyprenyltransferase